MPYSLPAGRVAIMGVLNVTPDSFSDGGQFLDSSRAIEHAIAMAQEGADLIDVGGESTRPGAEPVPESEELRRVLPVVKELASQGLAVSIDTSKPAVAEACIEAGAQVVNDVTALRDPVMAHLCAEAACTVCLMHMKGDPRTMQSSPNYANVVTEVRDALLAFTENAMSHGVRSEHIWLDPGIGFGKTVQHNLTLIAHLHVLVETGYPVLVGVSRKSFIGKLLGSESDPVPSEDRLEGSLAAQVVAQLKGARIIRTHDVAATKRAATIAQAILSQG